jgi:FdhD protein
MTERKATRSHRALWSGSGDGPLELLVEEPLAIRIHDNPYAVVMRTPGDEAAHAAGFCLGEGVVDSPSDLETIGYDDKADPNTVDVWLTPERRRKVGDILERRGYVSQTSCGICGKEMLSDIYQKTAPAENGFEIDSKRVFECIDRLSENQKHYKATRSSHAALLLDDQLSPLSFAEDVGRHNALDKAVGEAFMGGTLHRCRIAVLSSRNSYELTQKAARARIPILVSISRPTALAVEMGRTLNMTLAFPAGDSLVVVCGEHRIR